jgi:hypothetical protein
MTNKLHRIRDAFAFSLRGMTATSSYFIMPVVDDNWINNAWDEKLANPADECGEKRAEAETPVLGRPQPNLT